jgi:hypothetical protein
MIKLVEFVLAYDKQKCYINPEYIAYITSHREDTNQTAIWMNCDLSAIKHNNSIVPLVIAEKIESVLDKLLNIRY